MKFLVARSTATGHHAMTTNADVRDNDEESGDSTKSDIGIDRLDLNGDNPLSFNPRFTPSAAPESGTGYLVAGDASLPDTIPSTTEDGFGSSGRKRRRSRGESSGRSTRTSYDSIGAELVEIGRRCLDIMEHLLKREIVDRPVVYSIEQCLNKLHSLEGISPSQILIVADVLGNPYQRTLLITMTDCLLMKWIEKQELHDAMKASMMGFQSLTNDFPGYSTQFPPNSSAGPSGGYFPS